MELRPLKIRIEGIKAILKVSYYPENMAEGRNNYYLGYADDNKDFLVIWGAGMREGLKVNRSNADGRLFLNILHKGDNTAHGSLSLEHSNLIMPLSKIELIPSMVDAGVVRMNQSRNGGILYHIIYGKSYASIHPRWFPPRMSEGIRSITVMLTHRDNDRIQKQKEMISLQTLIRISKFLEQ